MKPIAVLAAHFRRWAGATRTGTSLPPTRESAPGELRGWRAGALGAALLLASTLVLGAVILSAAPDPGRGVVVVTAPWHSDAQAVGVVAGAGGDIVSGSRLANVLVAKSDEPDFIAALYEAGAWLVLGAPSGLACLQ